MNHPRYWFTAFAYLILVAVLAFQVRELHKMNQEQHTLLRLIDDAKTRPQCTGDERGNNHGR